MFVRLDQNEGAQDDHAVVDATIVQSQPVERNVNQRLLALRTTEREMRHRGNPHLPTLACSKASAAIALFSRDVPIPVS
jgi:hypothetical protein